VSDVTRDPRPRPSLSETAGFAMVILGAILVVAGSAIVLGCAIFWAWSAYRQKRLSGPDEGTDHPPEVPTP